MFSKKKDMKSLKIQDVSAECPSYTEEKETAEGEEATEETTEAAKEEEAVEVELLNPADYDVTVDIDVDLKTTKDKALYKKTQDILASYLAGDKTEEAFAELAVKHSEDSNAADGGIYEDVPMGQMVPEFEGWSLAEGRKAGDVGIVETEFGYHIMYFSSFDELTYRDYMITNDLKNEDLTSWFTALTEAVTSTIGDTQYISTDLVMTNN